MGLKNIKKRGCEDVNVDETGSGLGCTAGLGISNAGLGVVTN
jgi:hypothetical protein